MNTVDGLIAWVGSPPAGARMSGYLKPYSGDWEDLGVERALRSLKTTPSAIEKWLKSTGIAPPDENRRACRELLLTTAGLGEFISACLICGFQIELGVAAPPGG